MSTCTSETPRVWIGSLHAYNEGRLVGEWTDADDLEQLEAVAARVLAKGGGEEIALMDREGFGDLIGEYTQLSRVAEIAQAIEEHGEAFLVYWSEIVGDLQDKDIADAIEQFEEAFCGEYDSLRDYAEELAEDIGAIDHDAGWPMNCIDWDRATRELSMDYSEAHGYVFRCL
jgi:antirestriction protein